MAKGITQVKAGRWVIRIPIRKDNKRRICFVLAHLLHFMTPALFFLAVRMDVSQAV